MKNRSMIHMLHVLATRMEDNAPKEMIATLRRFAKEFEARRADGRTNSPEEEKRIEQQRMLFVMLPSSDSVDRLREAMKQRAYDLMWDGAGQETDAILEFLPSRDADEVLNAWSNDVETDEPKSRFH